MSFAEWTSADRAILLLCTKTYDNPVVLARIPLRHLLVPIQNGFDPVLNELNHPFEGIASFVSQCEANRPSTRITRIGELYLGGRRRLLPTSGMSWRISLRDFAVAGGIKSPPWL
jgi:2-dehydropantoate 2-reductase